MYKRGKNANNISKRNQSSKYQKQVTMGELKDLLAKDIKEITGIDSAELFRLGIIDMHEARKWVVLHRYYQMVKTGRTYTDVKYELSEIYGVSISLIEKMLYRITGKKRNANRFSIQVETEKLLELKT